MEFGRWKLAIAALLIAAALVGLVLHGSTEVNHMGHPDWQTKTIITNSQLDVEVINSTLDVNVTNSVLNISGQVEVTNSELDVNVTNTSLDVNVTNSTLNVEVQGTANVEIQNAILNVATMKEQASQNGNISLATTSLDLTSYSGEGKTIYTNSGASTVYLEMITAGQQGDFDEGMFFEAQIKDDTNTIVGVFYANANNLPLNFDPAIPLPPNWSVYVYAQKSSTTYSYTVSVGILIRTG